MSLKITCRSTGKFSDSTQKRRKPTYAWWNNRSTTTWNYSVTQQLQHALYQQGMFVSYAQKASHKLFHTAFVVNVRHRTMINSQLSQRRSDITQEHKCILHTNSCNTHSISDKPTQFFIHSKKIIHTIIKIIIKNVLIRVTLSQEYRPANLDKPKIGRLGIKKGEMVSFCLRE